ncbi:MAG: SDR family oxidoreductase [Candidatus Caenarcaniphilales bacterium]|nr:SDR family oxidoreductase [Candidatus Caenarcaniphilales bacterium]
MQTIFITGTSRGLGLEFCRQYLEAGDQVIGLTRKLSTQLNQLKDKHPERLSIFEIDLADFTAFERVAEKFTTEAIDILINNAGIYGGEDQSLGKLDYEAWMQTLLVNTLAPLKLVEFLRPYLQASSSKKVINITSLMGSIDDNKSGGYYIYRSSKAALNMVSKSLAVDLKADQITLIALHPGWVQTDMGGARAPLKPLESVSGMRKVIESATLDDSGKFLDYLGRVQPW